MTTPLTRIDHPDYRPGCGEVRADREIILYAEAAQVWPLWETIYVNRTHGKDPYDGVIRDGIANVIAAGGVHGTLVAEFVADALTRPLPKPWTVRDQVSETEQWIHYTVAGLLENRRRELTPPATVTPPAENSCSHGVAFTAPCDECGV